MRMTTNHHDLLRAIGRRGRERPLPVCDFADETRRSVRRALDSEDDDMRAFFKSYAGPHTTRSVLPRFVLSLTASAVAIESVFSGAAQLDAPRRNRISSVVFPMLAVTQRYLQSHPDQSALISEIEQFLLEGGVDDC